MSDKQITPTGCVNCANLMGSIRHMQGVMERMAEDHERVLILREQEILDLRRANRANKSKWKNARRDFLAVKAERDALQAQGVSQWPEVSKGVRQSGHTVKEAHNG